MERLISEGSIRNYDAFYQTRDKIEIPMNLSASVMRDKDGILLGTVCVARDMREIQKLITDLRGVILHEFRLKLIFDQNILVCYNAYLWERNE